MKVELVTPQTTFKPVAITLIFETKDELDAFGALFNSPHVCETLEKLTSGRIDDKAIRRTGEPSKRREAIAPGCIVRLTK